MQLDLTGKSALVSGSYRGTGAIIAKHLADEGVHVYVHGFTAVEADAAVRDIPGATAVWGDICTDLGAEQTAEQCQRVAPVDILINNYGTSGRGSYAESSADDWVEMYQKNVLSAQRLIRLLTPSMCERGWGRVINLGTVGSTRPNNTSPHYYAAKGALANLTVSLARELGPFGITVNLVSPGLIRTAEVEQSYLRRAAREGWGNTFEAVEKHIAKDIPIGRIARREEVADLVVFLCSPRAAAIHGQNIRVDGGGLAIVS